MSNIPDLTPLDSSAISGLHYDPEAKVLTVQFRKTGKLYAVQDVSAERAAALEGHHSPGSYLNQHILPSHTSREIR